MMADDVQRGLPSIGFWTQESSRAADHRSKGIPGKLPIEVKLSDWQLIFLQSRANGCFCNVENLPHVNWQWPQNTWFQKRLSRYLHTLEPSLELTNNQRSLRRAPSRGRAARLGPQPALIPLIAATRNQ
jgi:hypothetical protein